MQKNSEYTAKKKFGQNFLIDSNIINKIIEIIAPQGKKIIEIGPGMGALSTHLVSSALEYKAFEIDVDMINYLTSNKILTSDQIVSGDFLKSNLDEFAGYEIVGNIPYYITSEIIFKIIENRHLIKKATLMVQDEVAQRLIAKINSPEYSKLSITVQYVANVSKELFVNKTAFNPAPKVNSAIVVIDFKDTKDNNFEHLKDFFKLCFLSRRKKLIWSLKSKYTVEKITQAYKTLNLGDNTRIQELELDKIVVLYWELEK